MISTFWDCINFAEEFSDEADMTVLSQTRVESEEAHFRQNPAPLLKVHQLRQQKVQRNPDLEQYQTWLYHSLDRFMRIRQTYLGQKLRIKDSWAFLFYRSLLLNTADFVVAQKSRQALSRSQIISLLALLKQNAASRYYLQGAKLSLLIESKDALSDAELFYLTRDDVPDLGKDEATLPGPLGSYHEKLAQDLLRSLRHELKLATDRRALARVQAACAVGCIALIPVVSGMMILP